MRRRWLSDWIFSEVEYSARHRPLSAGFLAIDGRKALPPHLGQAPARFRGSYLREISCLLEIGLRKMNGWQLAAHFHDCFHRAEHLVRVGEVA